jgi:prephenate dehydratase
MIISTLGPAGTDSEHASHHYNFIKKLDSKVKLFPSYNEAIDSLMKGQTDYCIIASAASDFSKFVYALPYRGKIEIADSFVFPTADIVLIKRKDVHEVKSVLCYAGNTGFVKEKYEIVDCKSKSLAPIECLQGKADAALTSIRLFDKNEFDLVENFGSFKMSWNVFRKI